MTDSDNPGWTAQDFARAKAASELLPPEAAAALVRAISDPPIPNEKLKRLMREISAFEGVRD